MFNAKWLLIFSTLPGAAFALDANHPYPGFRVEHQKVQDAYGRNQDVVQGSFSLREFNSERGIADLTSSSVGLENFRTGPLLAGGGRVGGGEDPTRQYAGPLWAPSGVQWCLAHTSSFLQTLQDSRRLSIERNREQSRLELLSSLLYLVKAQLYPNHQGMPTESIDLTGSLAFKTINFFTMTLEDLLSRMGNDPAHLTNTVDFLERAFEFLIANGPILNTYDRNFYIPFAIQSNTVQVQEADLNTLRLSYNLLEWFFSGAMPQGYNPSQPGTRPEWLAPIRAQGFVAARELGAGNGQYYFAKGPDSISLTILKHILNTIEAELGPANSVYFQLYQCRLEAMLPIRSRIVDFFNGNRAVYPSSKVLLNAAVAQAKSFVTPGPSFLAPCESLQTLIRAGSKVHPGIGQPTYAEPTFSAPTAPRRAPRAASPVRTRRY
ncbi:MAG: hypothetical protein EOP09_12160 [Proteobacteria bacterium]|nr:MAG: hypothetical protein EOP09_12160 [Pseudomonadota bacterium]